MTTNRNRMGQSDKTARPNMTNYLNVCLQSLTTVNTSIQDVWVFVSEPSSELCVSQILVSINQYSSSSNANTVLNNGSAM